MVTGVALGGWWLWNGIQQLFTGSGERPSATSSAPAASDPARRGPGTVEGIRAHAEDLGFQCEDEGQTQFSSVVCFDYEVASPAKLYIGGQTGGRPERLALDIQTDPGEPRDTDRLRLQRWLVEQYLGDPDDRARVREMLAAATGADPTRTIVRDVSVSGLADGSVIMSSFDWLPVDARSAVLTGDPAGLRPRLMDQGWACDPVSGGSLTCEAAEGDVDFSLYLEGSPDGTRTLYVEAMTPPGSQVNAAFLGRTDDVLGLFPLEAPAIHTWLDAHDQPSGATGYADGLFLDYYPSQDEDRHTFAGLYVTPPCWTGQDETC